MAAPMLCGGVTVYSPIKEQGAGPGKTVGIVGIGGLGHFGLIFAKALGAEVVAISHTESKRADAQKMGASKFIATSQGKSVFKENARTMDFIGMDILE
jgi:D-arabinose 1-dehydrogenase-like Zn-dependent alcohol dehydrogenase